MLEMLLENQSKMAEEINQLKALVQIQALTPPQEILDYVIAPPVSMIPPVVEEPTILDDVTPTPND
jgi:hypothetical protein